MVRTGVLIGLVLLSLLSSGQSAEVDQNTLAKITEVFQTRYQPSGETDSGGGVQYAVAINVPADQCGDTFSQNFLSQDDSNTVKQELTANHLYQGQHMVAATPKGVSSTSKIHSERALLMCAGFNQAVTPVQNLLNKDRGGCVVFYTYNSPCLEYCLNQTKDENERNRETKQRERAEKKGKPVNVAPAVAKCILNSLSMLSNHNGPKAFVFSQVYRNDINNPELAAALKKVAEQVPLYKCTTNSCVKCLNNNEIVNQCLS
ncbi:hypothetical protein AALO_G00203610 [Alosa alosa]|uniref:Uncharacterized protein n=1 Tax=Alosa alosa TaxID=278164 RepID=A0AAV6G3F1_9TELE|nr:uncharacterized protein LOC125308364 [Alosa alosa]KAG5269578.1 hypothetical protein AALO_G00203610 [Alosa alosa]